MSHVTSWSSLSLSTIITPRTTSILHLDLPSTCLHRESPEGQEQLQREKVTEKKDRRQSTLVEVFQDDEETEKETRRRKVRLF